MAPRMGARFVGLRRAFFPNRRGCEFLIFHWLALALSVAELVLCLAGWLPGREGLDLLSAQSSITSARPSGLCRWKRDSPPGLPTMIRFCYKAEKLFSDIRVTCGRKDSTTPSQTIS